MQKQSKQKNSEISKNNNSGYTINVLPKEFKQKPVQKSNKKLYIITSVVLIFIILLIAGFALFVRFSKQTIPVTEKPVVTEPVVNNEEQAIPEDKTTSTIKQSVTLSTPKATSTPTSSLSKPPEIPIGILVNGIDSDQDGLTDKEEAIFQSSFNRPDTDGDGFLDGNEVFHLYNPAAHAPVTMLESGILKFYRNSSIGYSLLYPALWKSSLNKEDGSVTFKSEEVESIKIMVVDTISSISLRSWYITEFPDSDVNKLQRYTSKEGYKGLQDSVRLNTYIKNKEKVFIISYDLGGSDTVWFRKVYDMMLNSLKID